MSFMQKGQSSIVITGGSSGIGFSLAKCLSAHGHEVIIVDKQQEKLDVANAQCSKLITICLDLQDDSGRNALKERIASAFPQVNVLINAACVNNNPPSLRETTERDWELHKEELEVNLLAPVHLTTLLLPLFSQKPNALIINVTSIFAFFPLASHPTFCAAKAALHSFSQSLRQQLRETNVAVVELVPPLIEGPTQAPQFKGKGLAVDDFVQHALSAVLRGETEIGFQDSERVLRASRKDLDAMFLEWNRGSFEGAGGKAEPVEEKGEEETKKEISVWSF